MKNFKAFAVCCVLLCGLSLMHLRAWAAPTEQPVANSIVTTKTANSPSTDVSLHAQMQEQTKTLAELQARQNDLEKRSLDAERKSIDWWFAALAILTTVVAALGALLPYLMGRKDKELLQAELQNARDLVASIKTSKTEGEALVADMKKSYTAGQDQTPAQKQQIQQEAQSVANNPATSKLDQLYARAVLASQVDAPTLAQASEACQLWQALTLADPTDARAAFNYAYWLQDKTEKLSQATVLDWQAVGQAYVQAQALDVVLTNHLISYNWGAALAAEAQALKEAGDLPAARGLWQQACEKYAQALEIKPDMHEAAYNWGNALGAEARALKEAGDLPAARSLWSQACEKYKQALAIKLDKHEAAYNWGSVLGAEARALKEAGDLPAARSLWSQACEKYKQVLAIKPDMHEAAYNWGNALDDEARALKEAGDLPTARGLWLQAGERYAQALAIKPDKHEAAYNWGNVLDDEARALKETGDLTAARGLWRQAGEKYAQALAIKPDKHEAANYWGSALGDEAQAIKAQEPEAAHVLLRQAQTLLESHQAMSEAGAKMVAYNLACVYSLQGQAQQAVEQLEVCRLSGKLEGRLKSLWRTDSDLDPIRQSPEYLAWKQKHFPNE